MSPESEKGGMISMRTKERKGIRKILTVLLLLLVLALLALRLSSAQGAANERQTVFDALRSALHQANRQTVVDDLLILVNPWNSIPDGYSPQLRTLSDGTQIAEKMYDDLMEMLNDCRDAGHLPYICSGYRTQEKQQQLFDDKVNRLIEQNYTYEEAVEVAATEVAVPGTSEHQLGLAVDIVDGDYGALDYQQANTATQSWLMENCWDYGFILRYPENKTDITGIIYEPWHYRYVGPEAANEMRESGKCLEEYLAFR